MEAAIGFLYSAGLRISAILLVSVVRLVDLDSTYMGTKADVPEDETKMIKAADMPVKKVGLPMTWYPYSVIPSGARAGLSWTPTAIVMIPTDTKSVAQPIQAGIRNSTLYR